ncbi:ABC transporter ATP-binding protein [Cellulomonas sp. zg-ZUI222]|uniref:Spermidine/putrescine import ATP-binding protein PotA n=1 Tax=Cellulomonas wangleii TaxID=2816956 RepID=A0ABX8DAV7_9CELL|nr:MULTISPECIES: ABC transporter ATP-binding protein [Cellulomonas]MBO0900709.1 ABC transporter ATP-binding protein [Cellulomonas sp. zg-ZUI22]MBO0921376.1 ABC transporter ATP-binding protein [Cellulomonas wangleii]MBO0925793.1 ABC transporter ATP-binding protein [Cellulomonas wangleii]QVI63686.1 ABC transporter ATP-binding protein [Cellulomonas wangleii]
MTAVGTDDPTVERTAAAGAALEIDGVSRRFGEFLAVDDLTLAVPSGTFFALLGPSGCGKTTTLRMVAGLERPSAGTVRLAGQDVTDVPAHRRPVNTVFQSYALFPHLDVLENVAFGLRRRRARDVRARALEALELVELAHLADRRPTQLSGGQQQRVALARAVVNRPALLLLDEPLGALDLKLRRRMQLELKRIQAEVGITFVHVTHDQEEAMTMADTVAVMNRGRVEQVGAPAELYEHPRTAFVANFLGQSNLVPGTVVEVLDGGRVLGVDVTGARLRVPAARNVAAGPRVLVGVRPEKIRLVAADEQVAAGQDVLRGGTVVDASFTGVSTQYQVDVGGLATFGVFAQNAGGATVHPPGTPVALTWDPVFAFALDGDEEPAAGTVDLDDEP